ncbi:unnamed protein product [Caenorhabditis sp. 36 PRJEB53466]|nr:unnamed protein product [Caenorhabditis sp. 36 PRJEB53466]
MPQNRPNTCEICHQKAFGYNYEVVSCNACKMFFRRSLTEKVDEVCRRDGKCFDGNDLEERRPRCRACRLRKCIALGMRHRADDVVEVEENRAQTSAVSQSLVTQQHVESIYLEKLYHLHRTRAAVYSIINVCEDPTFCDLVAEGSRLGTYARPQEIDWDQTARKMKPWGSMGVLLIVEMCKTLDVYNELLLSDRVLLLKNVALKSHHLSIAFDSFSRKKGRVFNPQDGEMFPQVLLAIPQCREVCMELLTTPVEPLIELNVTESEYLLLNMIVICNSGIRGLSPEGQETLARHQRNYAKILLHQCLLKDPKRGPSRFAAIVSINQRLDKQISITREMDRVLRLHWDDTYYFPKIMAESCRMEFCRLAVKDNNDS